jgi:hypothetical protein
MPLVQTRGAASAQGFGEFSQQTAVNYIEDVFSTYLYTGNSSTQTITNGIDLAGKGGLVWLKSRNFAFNHSFTDTVRGTPYNLKSNTTAGQNTSSDVSAFNADGFNLNYNGGDGNYNGSSMCSWTFRKQAKFFDIVTYTGTGSNTTISHNLGSVPGMIIVKRTDTTGAWQVYHRSLANTEYLVLSSTAAVATGATRWNSTTPTSSVFSLGTDTTVNANAGTYVAYLFAHDAAGFGTTGTDNVISCGSFTTGADAQCDVSLGYEAQYILFKPTSTTGNWFILDNMRGMPVGNGSVSLYPNTSGAEVVSTGSNLCNLTATGFNTITTNSGLLANTTYIYMAIRRPMKVPTTGTSVFSPIASSAATGTTLTTNFLVDFQIETYRDGGDSRYVVDRLRGVNTNGVTGTGGPYLVTQGTAAEVNSTNLGASNGWNNTGFKMPGGFGSTNSVFYSFSRRPGFFDEVCYTTPSTTIYHNLGVRPELIIYKNRTPSGSWYTLANLNGWGYINNTSAWTGTGNGNGLTDIAYATATTIFSQYGFFFSSGESLVAYLFATCPGVSKVGSYTGNGTTQAIACGFTGGARFVLIKRTDDVGDWYVYDTARGMTTLTDPYLLLNSTAAESATLGSVTTTAGGFTLNASILSAINTNAASYIFLAIA